MSANIQSSGDLIADRRFEWARGLTEAGDTAAAAELLGEVVGLAPGFAAAWFALGEARERLGDAAGAVTAFEKARTTDPRDAHGAAVRLARLGALPPVAMPIGYIQSLFDGYAPKFEESLAGRLGYRGPRILLDAVRRVAPAPHFAAALDLGCGTGLAGETFRPFCASLTGVDLSPGMLALARDKKVYDRFAEAEAMTYLRAVPEASLDLIIAADVFIYFHELMQVGAPAARALRPGGLIAFSVETHDGDGVILRDTLRYAHSEAHVRGAVAAGGLELVLLEKAWARREKGDEVPGLVVVAKASEGLPPPLEGEGWGGGCLISRDDPPPDRLRRSTSPSRGEVKESSQLPDVFTRWFASRGWVPRAHQLALLEKARAGKSSLLIAPTGGGKTLAGFLPTLVELASSPPPLRGRSAAAGGRERGILGAPNAAAHPPPQPSPSRGEEEEERASRSDLPHKGGGEGRELGGGEKRRLVSTGRNIRREGGLHTLYISPLKALAVDIARNLEAPVAEMKLPIRLETRTGDTPTSKRQRQRRDPPDILLTTPEQLALLLATANAPFLFGSLKRVILDELHSLVLSKRGDLLSLGLARLFTLAPDLVTVGLSATVAEPDELCRFLVPQSPNGEARADLVVAEPGAQPDVSMLQTTERLPWAGHSARHALGEMYDLIKRHKTTLLFVNTRSQAEFTFQALWGINDDNLAIALHHGSLDVGQRRKVEDAMAAGKLRAVVATSSLDLGIDWGDVDLVVNIGAPKGSSRLLQRIGRANHRLDEPSKAVLVPSNRFEVLECTAAIAAVAENAQDTPPLRTGALDVLAQHVLGRAVGEPFLSDELYDEVLAAAPYAKLARSDFDAVVDFVATGGYALKAYERFAKIRQNKDGHWRITHPNVAQRYRMNIGTIVEADMLKVRLMRSRRGGAVMIPRGGRVLGQVEEYFIEGLTPGDTFVFAGEILKYEALVENEVYVSRSAATDPKVPAYEGGKFPLSTYLAARVRGILADPKAWGALPDQVREWLEIQKWRSLLPPANDLLVETFPRAAKNYLVCYPFEGRLAHQTLGMLLTRRLERWGLKPLGFVANEYALAVWGLGDMGLRIAKGGLSLAELFAEDMLGDDLEAWLDESALMKRTFRTCAIIAGLIERRFPGEEKTRRQLTISTDLVYDVLRKHQADHILLRAARADAATGLLDIKRLSEMLSRVQGRIVHKRLDHVSPLAVPVMLEIGRETVYGEAADTLLAEAADELIKEAMN